MARNQTITRRIVERLPRRVAKELQQRGLLPAGAKILIAVSGGPDSIALLDILCQLAPRHSWRLGVLHVNHGLREAAAAEAGLVRQAAAARELPCYCRRLPFRAGDTPAEEVLREKRRRIYHYYLARGWDYVATGHHAGDRAEMLLMRIIRGTSPDGMAGIRWCEDRLVRPLLALRKEELLDYVKAAGLPFARDKSNLDPRYTRNRMRRRWLPALSKENPRLAEALLRLAELCDDDRTYWEKATASAYRECLLTDLRGGRLVLDARKTSGYPPALRRRVIRTALRQLSPAAAGSETAFSPVHQIATLLASGHGRWTVHLHGRLEVSRQREALVFRRRRRRRVAVS